MKLNRTKIHAVIQNHSRFPIALVWENAKDLEHVAHLHQRTNKDFEILYVGKESGLHEYDVMSYRSRRKFFCFSMQACGFRKILETNHLYQIEYLPLLRMTVALNSVLRTQEGTGFPTLMVDEVVIEGPWWLRFFQTYVVRSMKRHTGIQCLEDEGFRARRQDLLQRGIHLPYKLYSESALSRLARFFKERISPCES